MNYLLFVLISLKLLTSVLSQSSCNGGDTSTTATGPELKAADYTACILTLTTLTVTSTVTSIGF